MRIMVTGSRNWDKRDIVRMALERFNNKSPVLLVGDCPTGADRIATIYAVENAWPIEIFKADWLRHGRAAGPIRNGQIVKAEPDVCLGFVRGESRGTLNALKQAQSARVPIYRYDYGVEDEIPID